MEELIRELLPRVRDAKVREAAESLLDGRAQMIPVIGPLLEALKEPKPRWEDLMAAAWALGRAKLTPDQSEAAAATLGWHLQARPLTPPTIYDRPGWATVLVIISAIVAGCFVIRLGAGAGGLIMFAGVTGALIHYLRSEQGKSVLLAETTVRSLERIGSPNVLKPIVQLLRQVESIRMLPGRTQLREVIVSSLKAILSAIARCDFGDVTQETVLLLPSLLKSKDQDVPELALRSLRAVGDGRAIPAVEGLIKSKHHPGPGALAEETLAVLTRRKKEAADSANLLRAATVAGDEGLLRPYSGSAGNEESLLRVADSVE